MKCKGCDEEYIGESCRTLRERVALYKNRIADEQRGNIYVEKHVRTCGNQKFSICPFLQMRNDDTVNRKTHESAFINEFKPTLNRKS